MQSLVVFSNFLVRGVRVNILTCSINCGTQRNWGLAPIFFFTFLLLKNLYTRKYIFFGLSVERISISFEFGRFELLSIGALSSRVLSLFSSFPAVLLFFFLANSLPYILNQYEQKKYLSLSEL